MLLCALSVTSITQDTVSMTKKKCLSPKDLNEIEDEEEVVDDIQMRNGLK